MSQPTFVQKIDGSANGVHSLTLTPGATTGTATGELLLVGVVLNPNGVESPQQVAGIVDSQGTPVVGGHSTGVPVNNWVFLGSANNNGMRMEWWACKGAQPITWLTINITGSGSTGLQSIAVTMLEYSGAGGVNFPVFQALQSNQNTVASQYILETAATTPNSGSALMIGLFAMLGDTFNASPPTPSSSPQTVRTTNSLSIPPALSWQIIEQSTPATVGTFTASGETVALAVGALNITAESATQLATANNVAESTLQCFYLIISGGLILNTPPGFSDQPDTSLAAGQYALGGQLAKISSNAALGMCRMEIFQDLFQHGQNASGPWVSPVDGYTYQLNELTYIWGIWSTADPATGWVDGMALWYCNWNVDQETGDVTCQEWYGSDAQKWTTNNGTLQVFIIAQRQQTALKVSASPSWTQQQASTFVTDLAYSTDVLTGMNDNSKFAVIGQECIFMGAFKNGDTVPRPVSPADDYEYAYSEVVFAFSWMFTTANAASEVTQPTWDSPGYNLATLGASINASTGVVSCAVAFGGYAGNGNTGQLTTYGKIAVFAFCQRARTGAPSSVANKFAEINNELFYPGNDLPAGIGAQIVNNINEAALTPEFFGPTLYELGATIPLPVSPIDGYTYQRSELAYIWEWGEMVAYPSWPPGTGANQRTALFSAQVNQETGVVENTTQVQGGNTDYTSVVWRLPPGGSGSGNGYVPYTGPGSGGGGGSGTVAAISVIVVAMRSAQQTEISGTGSSAPNSGSTVADQLPAGQFLVNGV
jgi:hypothetical protein